MAQQHIDIGTPPTGIGGDTPRTAFQKSEDNFTQLFDGQEALAQQVADAVADVDQQLTDAVEEMNQKIADAVEMRELAYAESQASFSAGTTATDIPGLTITFVVPSIPVYLDWGGSLRTSAASALGVLSLVVNGTARSQIVFGGDAYRSIGRRTRIGDLAPGSVATVKLQLISSTSGQTASTYGGAGDRPYLGATT